MSIGGFYVVKSHQQTPLGCSWYIDVAGSFLRAFSRFYSEALEDLATLSCWMGNVLDVEGLFFMAVLNKITLRHPGPSEDNNFFFKRRLKSHLLRKKLQGSLYCDSGCSGYED